MQFNRIKYRNFYFKKQSGDGKHRETLYFCGKNLIYKFVEFGMAFAFK